MSTVYPQLILKGSWYLRSKAHRGIVLLYVPTLGMVWGFPFIWLAGNCWVDFANNQ